METNKIILGNCFDVIKNIPDGSIDAVITDPPYGIGVADWDVVVNIPLFTSEVKRVCNGFYAFFGQMPSIIIWINEANNLKFHYCEHISWVKRSNTPSYRLSRLHESIIIYSLNNKRFYQHKGNFEDVKLPGILYDVNTIEGLDRYIKDLWIKLQTGEKERYGNKNGKTQDEFKRFKSPGDRSPRKVNFTNVWSFLPPVYSHGRVQKQSYLHPTEKPIEVMKRLVEMLTPENGTVLDPFSGVSISTNRFITSIGFSVGCK